MFVLLLEIPSFPYEGPASLPAFSLVRRHTPLCTGVRPPRGTIPRGSDLAFPMSHRQLRGAPAPSCHLGRTGRARAAIQETGTGFRPRLRVKIFRVRSVRYQPWPPRRLRALFMVTLAWPRTATPDCMRIWFFVSSDDSSARSASRMRELAAARFSRLI